MLGGTCPVDKDSCALNDQIYAHLSPWELCGVTVGHNPDLLAVHTDVLIINSLDISLECAEDGVVLEQVAGLLDSTRVVDGNDLQVGALPPQVVATQEVASNTSETVDADLDLLFRYCYLLVADRALQNRSRQYRLARLLASVGREALEAGVSQVLKLTVEACVATLLLSVCSRCPHRRAFAFFKPENSVKAAAGCSTGDLVSVCRCEMSSSATG